ncbi:right-handed parallel beta-helix repeat-containing protein [Achromobacter sp. RTa]|uniref:right-handed parallel beta-helix repeat-containing protein n=1 Tax=Achromobacter sp. RTa TaxID=1532557 RepID=UPI0009E02A4A|nr:right-handed parallel beta-helix repeat-containing protein [Achromobacter sp. RTa]
MNAPIASLSRAQEIVAANASGHDEIRVLLAPGIYRGQGVEWRTFPGIWIRFLPLAQGKTVVFDGRGGAQSFFFKGEPPAPQRGSSPVSMKLEFNGITIRNYCEGISLRSWADDVRQPGGRDVVIRHNTFENIGSKYDPVLRKKLPRGQCTAALRLQGVGHGRVEDNSFKNIINLPKNQTGSRSYGSTLLHAIYISNMSRDNVILRNRFENFSGDAIRIRDASDRNKIAENVFGSASKGAPEGQIHAISQWHCNPQVLACIERAIPRNECESSKLELSDNRIQGKNVASYADRTERKTVCAE